MIKVIKDERRRKCDEHGMKNESDESNESTTKGLMDRRRFQSRTIFRRRISQPQCVCDHPGTLERGLMLNEDDMRKQK